MRSWYDVFENRREKIRTAARSWYVVLEKTVPNATRREGPRGARDRRPSPSPRAATARPPSPPNGPSCHHAFLIRVPVDIANAPHPSVRHLTPHPTPWAYECLGRPAALAWPVRPRPRVPVPRVVEMGARGNDV